MKKLLTFCVMLFCVFSINEKNVEQASLEDEWSSFEDNGGDQLPRQIRMCLKVKCDAGMFCFNGRCLPIDYACINKMCKEGFRCNKGECVKQIYQPKKQICKPLGFTKDRIKCDANFTNQCKVSKLQPVKSCGFDKNGKFNDFNSPCEACSNTKINFVFATSCNWAPRVCQQKQECMNGACTQIFTDQVFKNRRSCNLNSECKINEQCAGHKCLDKRDVFNYLQSKSETSQVGINIK